MSIEFDDYRECLFSRKEKHRKMNVIRSHCQDIYIDEINKIALSSDDDKRVNISDGIHTLASSSYYYYYYYYHYYENFLHAQCQCFMIESTLIDMQT